MSTEISCDEDYCITMLAMAVVCHKVSDENINGEFTAEDLAQEVDELPFLDKNEWSIKYPDAVHHGMRLFKKGLSLGMEVMITYPINKNDKMMPAFLDFPEQSRGFRLKFLCVNSDYSEDEEVLRASILRMRSRLLISAKKFSLNSSVIAVIADFMSKLVRENAVENTMSTPKHFYKPVSQLCRRQQWVRSDNVINTVLNLPFVQQNTNSSEEGNVSGEVVELLELTLQRAKRRRVDTGGEAQESSEAVQPGLGSTVKNLYPTFAKYDLNDDLLGAMSADPKMIQILDKCPNTYNIYTKEEKAFVLDIFDHVKTFLQSEDTDPKSRQIDLRAAEYTSYIVYKKPRFAGLEPKTILYWDKTKYNVARKRGRRVNEEFERDVWGNLMICVIKNSTQVDIESS